MVEENQTSCCKVSARISEKITVIDKKINELQQIKNMLVNGVELCLNGCAPSTEGNCTLLAP